MYKFLTGIVCVVALAAGAAAAQAPAGGSVVVKLDPALDELVSAGAKVEPLQLDYFGLVGRPVWIPEGQSGYLLVGDSAANTVYKWTPDGKLTPFLERVGYSGKEEVNIGAAVYNDRLNVFHVGPTGLTVDPQGRLIVAATGDRTLIRIEKDGKRTVLADRVDGKRLNSPIEAVVKANGAIYFTDATAGLRGRDKDPLKELPYEGVYLIKDGKVQLLDKEMQGINPGGIAMSPDEKVLYVAGGRKIVRYDIRPDDTIANARILADLTGEPSAMPSLPRVGVRTDQKGNLYASGPGGIWILSPAGKHIGSIRTPEAVGNLAFGDADGKTLYIGTRRSLYRVRLNVAGGRP